MRCLSTITPLLDPLESRLLLSALLRNQTLIVEGTSAADSISIGTRDGGANIRVIINAHRSYRSYGATSYGRPRAYAPSYGYAPGYGYGAPGYGYGRPGVGIGVGGIGVRVY